ncbi:hypothetical protein N656DRAFT_775404 [Canariomyces notabilis]|uniref:Fungal calcium binding protein domain-containing protein n=1 Tax=Canariomyces notabilis TaxID=2074819 RepID=A0AAN6TK17_9PEZI|nr:hypothetical protein N656DRAFT_775404 [Canariomyces arenarius]
MKLAITSTLALLTAAMAAPSSNLVHSGVTPRAEFNQAEVFSFAPSAACNVLSCIGVIGQALCIADAIDRDDYAAILKCADRKELCGCAGCFNDLSDFLTKYGLC